MQSCWNEDPDMRPTSRNLEMTFNSWIESIANRQLICPKVVSTKETTNINLKTENDDSAPTSSILNSSSENIPSQPLPSLSDVQHKCLEEQDERRKYEFHRFI